MKQKKVSIHDEVVLFMLKVMGPLFLIIVIAAGVDIARLIG